MSESRYKLYHYWRSSSSWRVRFALAYKKIPYEAIPVSLLDGESESATHLKRNPAGLLPVLELASDQYLTESLPIIRYLEDTHPNTPKLFPGTAIDRAKISALAEMINSGIQPLQNIPVFSFHSDDVDEQKRWVRHWIENGLKVYESRLKETSGSFSYGNDFTLADVCLVPQLYSAERYSIAVSKYPLISRIFANVQAIPAYLESCPDSFKPLDFKG